MIYLVDTNVLLRFSSYGDPRYQIVQDAVYKLKREGQELRTTFQNLSEFWNVSARPIDQNGFGRTPSETDQMLRYLEYFFPLLQDLHAVYPEWKKLVVDYEVSGVQVHDAKLVASMIVHEVKHILTFNVADFTRYASEGIVAVVPEEA